MKKRKISQLAILTLFVYFSIINLLPVAKGYNYTFSDAEDDVIRECDSAIETGDYYDELDIVKIVIADKHVNLTVAGNLSYWNSSYSARIYFSDRFYTSSTGFSWSPPYYILHCANDSGPLKVILRRGYSLGGGNFAYEVWNGTGWEDENTAAEANIITDVTEHSIIIDIPLAVEPIPDSMQVVVAARLFLFGDCDYMDFAPELSSLSSSQDGISGYNLFIMSFIVIGISLIMIKKYKK
ncbi:MAG: hypothetical protein ACFFAK_10190 [Promethearchaeota archaeon]